MPLESFSSGQLHGFDSNGNRVLTPFQLALQEALLPLPPQAEEQTKRREVRHDLPPILRTDLGLTVVQHYIWVMPVRGDISRDVLAFFMKNSGKLVEGWEVNQRARRSGSKALDPGRHAVGTVNEVLKRIHFPEHIHAYVDGPDSYYRLNARVAPLTPFTQRRLR